MYPRARKAVAWVVIIGMAAAATAAQAAQNTADQKEIASYRLTMEGLRKVQAATRSMVEAIKKDPKFRTAMKVQAEIDALEKKDDLTDAEHERLERLEQQLEELQQETNVIGEAESLSEMEAQIRKFPPIADALQHAGMSPREYATFMIAMMQASMAAGFKKSGMLKELPPEVNAENVRFIEEHEAELKAMQAEFEKLGRGGA